MKGGDSLTYEPKEAFIITLNDLGKQVTFDCHKGQSLMEAMQNHGIYVSAVCAGRGTCGKCKVQLRKGELAITTYDSKSLSKEELRLGYRLSCQAYPEGDCTIALERSNEYDFEIITSGEQNHTTQSAIAGEACSIAIDLGTTTLAISLLGLQSKSVLKTHTAINRQRAYGADVISRIQVSNDGKGELLRESIRTDLLDGIHQVMQEINLVPEQVKRIVIAGNTTMGHLLMGYSCESLGVYPFTPVNINTITASFEAVFASKDLDIPVVLLPGISTYVGGDIAAGLYACEFDRKDQPCMLIDLGTNGEMAIGNRERILVASTAAGPAFEGGNISCGVGSISGAICNVEITKEGITYQTIGQKPPIGICGTGVIEVVAELVRTSLVDETGLLAETYFDQGYELAKTTQGNTICFTRQDIRELQLAKAAIRAGLETLIHQYGISYQELDTIYLAGGFGYKINLEKAIRIGLFPKELKDKIKAIGNSSLTGATSYLWDEHADSRLHTLLEHSKEITLSNEQEFNELYIKHLFFSEEEQ